MIQETTFYRNSIKALVFDEKGGILLTKDEEGNKWDLPGGGMDWGETPQTCLAREIQEEMGLTTTWIAKHPSYFFSNKTERGMWFAFVIYEAKLEHLNFTPSDECMDAKFFTVDEIRNGNVFSSVITFIDLFDPEKH